MKQHGLLAERLRQAPPAIIEYNLPYPKVEFLNYACEWCGLVAHGSPLGDLKTLEPVRKSSDVGEFGNRQQIFCSPDAIYALWFAILDKEKYHKTRNGCTRSGTGAGRLKYYMFELPEATQTNPPYAPGFI